jgi:hypothetical protein
MNKNTYKTLIKNLLQYYLIKSSQLNTPIRYVVYRISDDNLTLFEKLSINNQIGIITNLSDIDSNIILKLLESLYSKNYYIFEKDFIQDVLYDSDIENEDFGLNNLLNELEDKIINLDKWIEYLNFIPSKIDYTDEKELNEYIDDFGTDIYRQQIYNNLPNQSKFYKLNHKQKFYTLDELHNL